MILVMMLAFKRAEGKGSRAQVVAFIFLTTSSPPSLCNLREDAKRQWFDILWGGRSGGEL